jgi:heme-degrading monooxygenase HmoA
MFTFINRFQVTGDVTEFERVLNTISEYMTRQPGFRSARLYRSTCDQQVYVETAEWDSAEAHQQALSGGEFRGAVGELMKLATAEPSPFDLLTQHDTASATTPTPLGARCSCTTG